MKIRTAAIASALALAATGCSDFDFGIAEPEGSNPEIGGEDDFVDPGFDDGGFAVSPPARLGQVVQAERTPPPLSGGTLAVSRDGAYVVAADPDRDQIYVVRMSDGLVRKVTLEAGSEPGRVTIDGDGRAHAVLRGSGELARIDLVEGVLLGRADVCAFPRGVAYEPSWGTVMVACASGDVVSLAADSYNELARKHVARDLRDVVIDKTGALVVTRYRSAEILRLAADLSVERRLKPRSFDGSQLGFGSFEFDENGEPIPPPASDTNMSPTLAWRAVSTEDGDVVVIHQRSLDGEVQPSEGGYGSGFGACGAITGPTMTMVGEDVGASRPVLGEATLAVDVAVSSKLNVAAVAVPGAYLRNERGTLQLYSASVTEEEVGGCAFPDAMGGWEGEVTSVAFSGDGTLFAFSRDPAQLSVFTNVANAVESSERWAAFDAPRIIDLDTKSVRDTGHDLFHADVGGGLACASCHGEALDDGHVWTFAGFGPRRTQNMRGGLKGTEPFHWEGDMASFGHLVDEVMTGRMGGFVVEPQYVDALATWLDAQPALKLPVSSTAAVERGKAAFEAAGCDTCHSGAKLTNNISVDVGTGGIFQVPSLVGLAMRAPFMHDGCAATLKDRFDPSCGGAAHGNIGRLSTADIADLVSYLESL